MNSCLPSNVAVMLTDDDRTRIVPTIHLQELLQTIHAMFVNTLTMEQYPDTNTVSQLQTNLESQIPQYANYMIETNYHLISGTRYRYPSEWQAKPTFRLWKVSKTPLLVHSKCENLPCYACVVLTPDQYAMYVELCTLMKFKPTTCGC